MRKLTLSISLSFLFYIASSLPKSTNTIAITEFLCDGETLVSANGAFTLGFFSPQNNTDNRYLGIWHTKVSTQTIVWVANRNTPIIYSPATLSITMTGTLIITDNDGSIIWTSGSEPITDPMAQLLDTGNFVIRQSNVNSNNDSVPFAWQSFDHPTDTLLPGMKLGLDLTTGLNRTLTSWASPTDPSSGSYTLSMDIQGYPQIFLQSGFVWEWRSGPWNGLGFSGIPEMSTTNMTISTFVNNQNEVYSMYNMHDPLVITRLTVNPKGSVERLVWVQSSKSWNVFWSAPRDRCDKSPCGQFGVCDVDELPICNCLTGFKPRVPERWVRKDNSDGCVRKTELDCRNGTDGFMKLSMAKLPDTSRAVVNLSSGLDDCKAACLKNCSCTAYASANISGGSSGCIIWITELIDVRVYGFDGQDLYIRVVSADLADLDAKTDRSVRSHKTATVIALTVVLFVLLSPILVWTGHYAWKNTKKGNLAIKTESRGSIALSDLYSHESPENEDLELPMFDFCTIAAATNNFSVNNQLGEGGFGPVYKGILGGQTVAIKRLAKSSSQGIVEFKNEILVIARLQHRNLVRLLGCCIEGNERMLIYEYLPNKSLDLFLFDDTKSRLLDWETRYNIIMGIARGMLYLHQDSRFRIIHRDLKASNILLDNDLKPKISDFGMARIFKGDGIDINTNKIVGTYGYMSPEYAMDGVLSVKSDVYSFGVLVLEIISGRKNRGIYLSKPSVNLLAMTWRLWREGNGLHLVDESIGYRVPMAQVLRCIKVGLLCVQEWAEDRPTMSSVVLMLSSNDNSLLLPNPKQPAFVSGRIAMDDSSSCNMSSATTHTSSSVAGSNQHSSSGTDYTC